MPTFYTLPDPWMAAAVPVAALQGSSLFAQIAPGNFLAETFAPPAPGHASSPVLIWSGTLADDLFEADPRNFTARARDALHAAVTRLSAHSSLIIRPHARHILSDTISCSRFIAAHPSPNIRLLADPAALFTRSMLPTAEDHLHRIFESIATLPPNSLAGIILSNITNPPPSASPPSDTDSGLPLTLAPLNAPNPALDPKLLLHLYRTHIPKITPVLLLGPDPTSQIPLLGHTN